MKAKLKQIRIALMCDNCVSIIDARTQEFKNEQYLENAEISTRKQISEIKKLLFESETNIKQIILADVFSASDLYNEQLKEELLSRKLEGLENILSELF